MGCVEIKSIRKEGVIFNAVVETRTQEADSSQEALASEPDSEHKKGPRHFKKFLSPLCASMLLFIAIAIFAAYYHSRSVFDNYTFEKDAPGECIVRFNSDAVDSLKHNHFLQEHKDLCTPGSVLYVTAYENIPDISVVQCKNDYLDTKKVGNCRVMISSPEVK